MENRTMRRGLAALAAVLALQGCDEGTGSDGDRLSRIDDPVGDFLAGYVGARNGDVDVVQAEVTYDGATFDFRSELAGNVGTTAGALYVWGVNRGVGTARFGALAAGVLFDAVVTLRPDRTGSVRDLVTGVSTDLPAGAVTVSGDEIRARVAAGLLPSQGAPASQYTVNLWPRVGSGNNNQISDFAPDNSNAPVRDRS